MSRVRTPILIPCLLIPTPFLLLNLRYLIPTLLHLRLPLVHRFHNFSRGGMFFLPWRVAESTIPSVRRFKGDRGIFVSRKSRP